MSYKWPGIPNGDYSFDHGRAVWNKIINYLRRLSEKLDADIVDATADRRGMMTAEDKAALDAIPDTYARVSGNLATNELVRLSPSGLSGGINDGAGPDFENMDFGWDYDLTAGATLGLRSIAHETQAGWFNLYARDGTQSSVLRGRPNGLLTWNDNRVITAVDIMTGATSSAVGAEGIVPKPSAGDQYKCLLGSGRWDFPTFINTTTGTTNVSRPVWFSYQYDNTRPVYNTKFQYNPSIDRLDVGAITLSNTTDASGTADNRPAFIIGPVSGTHIEMDNNEIMVKYDETTPGALNINVDGGNVYIGAPSSIVQIAGQIYALNNITLFDSAIRAQTTYNDGSGTTYLSTILQTGTTNTQYGQHIALGGGSGTIVGAGESATAQLNDLIGSDSETLFLTADTDIIFRSNGNTWADKKEMAFSKYGHLTVPGNVYSNGVQLQNYTHPTTAGNKHIPSGGSSGQILRWSADGTAAWGADEDTHYNTHLYIGAAKAHSHSAQTNGNVCLNLFDDSTLRHWITLTGAGATEVTSGSDGSIVITSTDTTYSVMTGATASSFGTKGLVPRPSSGDQSKFLRGDATWQDALGYIASSLPASFESTTGAYIKFENGLLFQWGTASTTSTAIAPDGSQSVTVTFPLPYVGAGYYTTVASPLQSIPVIVNREGRGDGSYAVFRVTNKSSSNVTGRSFAWWALGRWK